MSKFFIKKPLWAIFFILLIIITVGCRGRNRDKNEPDPNYLLTFDWEEAVIVGYFGDEEEVIIPNMINGLPTRQIGTAGFMDNTFITSVVIPEGVFLIDSNAFAQCSNLTSVTLPSTLTHIGNSAFYLTGLTSLPDWPPELTEILPGVFSYSKLRSAYIAEGVTVIGALAFGNCPDLEIVSLPSTIISIDALAFARNPSLTTVIIPESVEHIEFSGNGSEFSNNPNLSPESREALRRVGYTGNF